MLKSYKTEINPAQDQISKIKRTIGVCRFMYNFYLAHNKEQHEHEKKFVSAYSFLKWVNNEYLPEHPERGWIKEVSSKSVSKSVQNAEQAYKRFFKGLSSFPRFKSRSCSDVGMYFVRNRASYIIKCERHRIKIPTLGWVRLKEKGYIPTNPKTHTIKSGVISCQAGRYYVSVLVEEADIEKPQLNDFGLGIDLGVKDFAVVSNGSVYKNINKTPRIRKLEKQLRRQQRSLSKKYKSLKERKRGEAQVTHKNIDKQIIKVQRLHQRLRNIRTDYINKCVSELVKTKPAYITIEDLNIKGMMKNRHLSKAVASQKFYEFNVKLLTKCNTFGIELRKVDRFYPSSKKCHECGKIKDDLKLSDRMYECECGYRSDRDYNASLNLRDAKKYKVA